ncbi:hypothetical protein PAAG_00688 [Paracoccidioides lutzii Pb01]|uniref:Uncharacterized protein n=1 Tax=Paracoccidioides lutzii (strain ATCC MYA-826 / Pb01) TaxID=502779 RepID=C1GQ93_PARBA|nr:hypothetical protein PAAG_00688 [Paracoccidioides lutzii Pb01]EEH37767.1 hypothetical protein PAAG_00688 [Paracoccidioides lutzii Pb01]
MTTPQPGRHHLSSQSCKASDLTLQSLPVGVEGEHGHEHEDFNIDNNDYADVIPPHPLGVKPSGNALTVTHNIRHSMGNLAVLSDELIILLLECLDSSSLLRLGATCKALYAFTRAEELWKGLFIDNPPKSFTWRGTWHATYLNLPAHLIASPDCSHLYSDTLHRPFYCAHISLKPYVTNIPTRNQIPRLSNLSLQSFQESWTNKPFILTEPVKQWPVYKEWSIERLLERYGDVIFRAEAVDWSLRNYVEYMRNNTDESPLYLFDRSFVEKMELHMSMPPTSTSISTNGTTNADANVNTTHAQQPAYTPPPPFTEDLFTHLGPHRPDNRWLIIGPPRSGSTFHKDPNATSAWNAVLRGAKYWIMFPSTAEATSAGNCSNSNNNSLSPMVPPPPGVYVSEDQSEVTSPLSIAEWLMNFHEEARKVRGCVEGVCGAGEVLHVPSGWWHLVVNIPVSNDGGDGGCCIAITQNFVPRGRLADVLGFLKGKREQVSGFRKGFEDPFGLFVERLRGLDGYGDLVEGALREVERRLEGKKGKRKWDEVVRGTGTRCEDGGGDSIGGEEGGGGGFSFGFGDDGSDVDVP